MAWRTANESWQQWNATVNLLITYGILDYIFSFILFLKMPLEKFIFLEKCFSSILRPKSWLAAEEAMQQSRSQPEQNAAGETAQSTNSHHDEPENPPGREEGFLDSPNNCAKTETGYPTPETEVIDMQEVEDNLPVVETGIMVPIQPDEHADVLEVPDKRSQHTDDDTVEHQNLPEWSTEAPNHMDDPTRQSSGHSIEFAPRTCLRQDQSLPTSGKTILDVPGPPPNAKSECPIPQDELLVQTHSATITELKLPCT
ncbi:hypothetical protein EDC04DRAFT_2901602 [Pisolithus marmoratus]|nr:hypothetical protein EDC04DRAFT_2901602 [Pisolithus marmoratus]